MEYSIAENFLLLVHHPERKRFAVSSVQLRAGFAGALLADLLVRRLMGTREGRLVTERNANITDEPWSVIMNEIARNEKKRKPLYWLRKISRQHRKYLWECMEKLAGEQIFKIEERQFLGIIPWKQSRLIRGDKRAAMVTELRSVLYAGRFPDDSSLVLLGLLHACGAYGVLSKKWTERWEIRKRIKNLFRMQNSTDIERRQLLDSLQTLLHAVRMTVASAQASHAASF